MIVCFAIIYICNVGYIYYFAENPLDYMDNLQYAKSRSVNLLISMCFAILFTLVFWAPGKTMMDWTEYDDVKNYGRKILRFLSISGLILLAFIVPKLELKNYAYLKQINESTIDYMVQNLEEKQVIFAPERPSHHIKRHGIYFSWVVDKANQEKYLINCINIVRKSNGSYCADIFKEKYENRTKFIKIYPFFYKEKDYPSYILFEIKGEIDRDLYYYTTFYKSEIKSTRASFISSCAMLLVVFLLTLRLFKE